MLKKIKIGSFIGLCMLSFLTHFIYKWFPHTISAIFFPVNESIFEHMKIIFTNMMIIAIFEIILFKKYNIHVTNYLFKTFCLSLLSIAVYLTIFIPIYNVIGENMFFSIGLLFIVFLASQYISYHLLQCKEHKNLDFLAIVLIICINTCKYTNIPRAAATYL